MYLVLGLVAMWPAAGASQERPPSPLGPAAGGEAPARPDGAIADQLWRLWETRLALLHDPGGNADQIDAIDERLVKIRDYSGLGQLQLFSAALVKEGQALFLGGRLEMARRRFDTALRLDPTMRQAYEGLADVAAARGGLGFFKSLAYRIQGFAAAIDNFWRLYFFIGRSVFVVGLTVLLTLTTVVGLFLLRYNRLLRHDVAERLPKSLPEALRNQVGWLLLALPILLRLGLLWTVAWLLLCLVAYARRGEQILFASVFVLILAAIPVTRLVNLFVGGYRDRAVQSIVALASSTYMAPLARDLEGRLASAPDDDVIHYVLGMSLYRAGRHEEALKHWKALSELTPDDPAVFINMGNTYFALERTAEARKAYQEAADLDPTSAVPYFNLGKLYLALERFEFTKAKSMMDRARELDPELVLENTQGDETGAGRVITIPLRQSAIWQRLRQSAEAGAGGLTPSALWPGHVYGLSLGRTPIFGAACLVLLLLIRVAREKSHAHACLMCGRATCPRCQRSSQSQQYCSQCLQLFIKRTGVDAAAREAKLLEIDAHERRERLYQALAAIFVPGTNYYLQGKPLIGTLATLAWIGLLVGLFARDTIPEGPYAVIGYGTATTSGWAIAVVVIIYCLSLWFAMRRTT